MNNRASDDATARHAREAERRIWRWPVMLVVFMGITGCGDPDPALRRQTHSGEAVSNPARMSTATAAAGLWQGTTYPPALPGAGLKPSSFLLLDTGGSGGSFGKGDIRHNLHDVAFWDTSHGWTCGYGGVFRSSDGGFTWSRMLPGGGWYQLEMSGPEDIWLLEGKHPGGIGKVWLRHSIDGGQTWREELPGKLDGYRDMYCRGAERWILTGTTAWHSSDGGATWGEIDFSLSGGFQPNRISIPADMATEKGFVVYVLGSSGSARSKNRCVLKSEDGGTTWRVLENLPVEPATHRGALFFASSHVGWLGGEKGQVWRTGDGGNSWQDGPLPTDRFVIALWFDQEGRGFASVSNHNVDVHGFALFESRDGGRTWIEAVNGAKQIHRFYSLGPQRLWFVGNVPSRVYNDLVGILQSANVAME